MSTLQDMQNSAMAASAKESEEGAASAPRVPQRRVARNHSGPQGNTAMGRRRPPGRSKSHKIGRPAFSKDLPAEPIRGVNRNKSGRLRSTPNRSRSFGRSVPDRSGSSGSLRAYRKQQQMGGVGEGDDVSVTDSVFTSASNQTLDSIMLRKKQFGPDGKATGGGMRMPNRSSDAPTFDFDDTLHTVDSINVHHRHVDGQDDDQGDFSVFSESFASTDTYDLSDYDETEGVEEEGVDVQETEFDEEEEEAALAGGDDDDDAMKE